MRKPWFFLTICLFMALSHTVLAQFELFPNDNRPLFDDNDPLLDSIGEIWSAGNELEAMAALKEEYQLQVKRGDDFRIFMTISRVLRGYLLSYRAVGDTDDFPLDSAALWNNRLQKWAKAKGFEDYEGMMMMQHHTLNAYMDMLRFNFEAGTVHLDSALRAYPSGAYRSIWEEDVFINSQVFANTRIESRVDTLFKYLRIFEQRLNAKVSELYTEDYEEMLYQGYGDAYSHSGDYLKAIQYHLESWRRIEARGGTMKRQSKPWVLFRLSSNFFFLERFEEAIRYTKILVDESLKNIDPNDLRMIQNYNLLGISYNSIGQSDSAYYWLNKSLEVLEANGDQGPNRAYLTLNIGTVYQKKQDFKRAEGYFRTAIKDLQNLYGYFHPYTAVVHQYAAFNYKDKGEHLRSLYHLDSALRSSYPQHTEGPLKAPEYTTNLTTLQLEILQDIVKQLVRVYEQESEDMKYLLATLDFVDLINELLQSVRNATDQSNSLLYANQKYKDVYETGLRACHLAYAKTNDPTYISKALNYMSLSKSILLLEELGEFEQVANPAISDSLRWAFATTKKAIALNDRKILELMSTSLLNDSIAAINLEKMARVRQMDQIRIKIKEALAEDIPDPLEEVTGLDEYRTRLDDQGEDALLEIFMWSSDIFLLGVSQKNSYLHRVPNDSTFKQLLNQTVQGLKRPIEFKQAIDEEQGFLNAAYQLKELLLAPILSGFEKDAVQNIKIIADGLLNELPFELLLLEKPSASVSDYKGLNYLMNQYGISYALSSRVKNSVNEPKGSGLLGMGFIGEGVADERAELGGLPGAEAEIKYLRGQFDGEFYLSQRGTKQAFLEKAGDYDVIHLALHGRADLNDRLNSKLFFNGEDDYQLDITDLYSVNLKSRMVVLSACESGLGSLDSGEGTFSVARGFAAAGVPSIVTSLWNVNDQAGAEVIKAFYGHLESGMEKDKALQKAKLDYLQTTDNITSHPYYWGSFVMIGDPTPIALEPASDNRLYLLVLVFLIVVAQAVLRKRKARHSQ